MSVSPYLDIFNISTARIESNSLSIPIQISRKTENENVKTLALIDSGAGGIFIDQNYARNSGLDIQQLEKLLKVFNVDGTSNKRGTIKYFIQLDIMVNGQQEKIKLLMTGLGKQRIILGFPWLNKHNPEINWQTRELNWQTTQKLLQNKTANLFLQFKSCDEDLRLSPMLPKKDETPLQAFIKDEKDEEEHSNRLINPLLDEEDFVIRTIEEAENKSNIWINTKTTTSQLLHQAHDEKKKADQFPEE